MDNQDNMTYLINTVNQIQQTITMIFEQYVSLNKKYDALDEKIDAKYDALDKKIDERYDDLDRKIDAKYDALDKKIDQYYEENRREHFKIFNTLAHIEKDIHDLRDDIDTVYALEKDSRKHIQKLM